MNCPKCQNPLREREKGDIVIDICPACRGVWLDAGEMEKLITQEQRYYDGDNSDRRRFQEEPARYGDSRRERERDYRPQGYGRDQYGRDQYGHPQKKRGGFLSNIFEGFGGEGADD
jgi:Zn-finger nucleic acid-binding protein